MPSAGGLGAEGAEGARPLAGTGKTVKQGSPKDPMETILDQWRQLFAELNMPFDPNDPQFAPILNAARQATLSSSQMGGVFGPYSQNQAERAYTDTAAKLATQRKGMAMQALGGLTSTTGQSQADKYGRALDEWKLEQQKGEDLWRLGGGIIGGLGGAIAGGLGGAAVGGVGAIPGAIAGATGGWNLGSNLGGSIGQQFQPKLPSMPTTFGGY